jgi:hypothetical protein
MIGYASSRRLQARTTNITQCDRANTEQFLRYLITVITTSSGVLLLR